MRKGGKHRKGAQKPQAETKRTNAYKEVEIRLIVPKLLEPGEGVIYGYITPN